MPEPYYLEMWNSSKKNMHGENDAKKTECGPLINSRKVEQLTFRHCTSQN